MAPADHTMGHATWEQAPRGRFLLVVWWLLTGTCCVPPVTLCTVVTTLTDQVLAFVPKVQADGHGNVSVKPENNMGELQAPL